MAAKKEKPAPTLASFIHPVAKTVANLEEHIASRVHTGLEEQLATGLADVKNGLAKLTGLCERVDPKG